MTDFQEYKYRGANGVHPGCAVNGGEYFCFEPFVNAVQTKVVFDENTQQFTGGNREDIFNIKQVLKKMGIMFDENKFNQSLDYTKWVSNKQVAEPNFYLNNKFKKIRKMNVDTAISILKQLHDLTWMSWKVDLIAGQNAVPIISGKDVTESLELIKPSAKALLIINYQRLELEYPKTLSAGALSFEVETKKLEMEHQLNTIKDVGKKEKKKKK